ncbi:aminoglycoside phosphotransferase family protein [Pseudarthrobacter raffinosi]|uniref:aminoglycoside phosphotransferase family protein n=1 Tax=Pseudarthrobacter raffinosi TaxID=2953651 RepID=UPI00208DE3F6|nr:aminoglycoside phosphotransferase family protein [Pseudarthrobacter sp. MDT3-9]MCO4251124.1 aminoglycoside phosphotransferase family protein [Pseudarthrobacter sp. MDT3-9]
MASLHTDEVNLKEKTVRRLINHQFPAWEHLALSPAGEGTDNRMLRLGDDLVVRLPRTSGTAADVAKEQTWLPRLAPHLPLSIPEPVAIGRPDESYPFPWSVYRWVDGTELNPESEQDLSRLGRDLAGFVRALHSIDLMGAPREEPLLSYRGGSLRDLSTGTSANLDACRGIQGLQLDLDGLQSIWQAALELDQPRLAHTWMHTDLKPSNLLVRNSVLVGVVDFGGLSVGDPTCEHAAVWDLPAEARHAYAEELGLDKSTRLRARAWALAITLSGVPYYWSTWPDFAQECVRRLQLILRDTDDV